MKQTKTEFLYEMPNKEFCFMKTVPKSGKIFGVMFDIFVANP